MVLQVGGVSGLTSASKPVTDDSYAKPELAQSKMWDSIDISMMKGHHLQLGKALRHHQG